MHHIFSINLILFFFVLCNNDSVYSQAKIIGEVSNKSGVLEFARVSISPVNKNVLTDTYGRFEFGDLAYGSYTIEVSAIGYKSIVDTIVDLRYAGRSAAQNWLDLELGFATFLDCVRSNSEDPDRNNNLLCNCISN